MRLTLTLSERQEQEKLVQWLRLKKLRHFAPTNENQGSFTNRKVAMLQEVKAKKMGKSKGVPDLFVFLPNVMLCIEMKKAPRKLMSGKTSKAKGNVSPEQFEWLNVLNTYPYTKARVCRGFDEAREFIEGEL